MKKVLTGLSIALLISASPVFAGDFHGSGGFHGSCTRGGGLHGGGFRFGFHESGFHTAGRGFHGEHRRYGHGYGRGNYWRGGRYYGYGPGYYDGGAAAAAIGLGVLAAVLDAAAGGY